MTTPETMPVLRARQTAAPVAPAAATATEALDVEMRRAQAISQAVQALPPAYQKQPGAVLLVDQWARAHGVDTLTAMQSVAFVKGRPVVDASMQRALASKAGYDVDITEGDGWAEVTVTRNGKTKSARFTVDEAKAAGLLGKDNWKNYQTDMLVARATARCLRRHAPEVVLGLADPDEIDTPMDVLQAAAATQPEPEPAPELEADVVDVEPQVEVDPSADPATEPTEADLKQILKAAGMTQADLLRQVPGHSLASIAADPEAWDQALTLIEAAS